MPEFAQFVAVPGTDLAFTLPDAQSGETFRQFGPFDLRDLDAQRTAVVMFKVAPAPPGVRVFLRFNGHARTVDFDFPPTFINPPPTRSWHEVLEGADLKAAGNVLVVSVSGQGSAILSDIVVLYHGKTDH
jgi:hypothetical protein